MAGHAQLKFVMTECSKTQIRLTGLKLLEEFCLVFTFCIKLKFADALLLLSELAAKIYGGKL